MKALQDFEIQSLIVRGEITGKGQPEGQWIRVVDSKVFPDQRKGDLYSRATSKVRIKDVKPKKDST